MDEVLSELSEYISLKFDDKVETLGRIGGQLYVQRRAQQRVSFTQAKRDRLRNAVDNNGRRFDRKVTRIQDDFGAGQVDTAHRQDGITIKLACLEVDIEVERQVLGNKGGGIGEREIVSCRVVVIDGRRILGASDEYQGESQDELAMHGDLCCRWGREF